MSCFYILFVISFISFVKLQSHLLSTILLLEFMTLSLFFILMHTYLSFSSEFPFVFLFLAIAVVEGALSLGLLILYTRSYGNDQLSWTYL